jgi:hypothetical protein
MVGVMTVAGATLVIVSLSNESFIRAQSRQIAPAPKVRLPDESTGIDEIAKTLVSSFDQVDIVALGMDADYLFSMGEDIGIVRMLEMDYPGRTLAVIPIGGIELPRSLNPPVAADYRKFDRALKTQVRPVLAPLDRAPFRDFTAEEFMGDQIFSCRGPGGCRSIFQGSRLTLGQMADACVYVGASADADTKAKPTR